MPLTKIKRGGLDTGITDNSDANALTFDSSENANFLGNVGVKQSSPSSDNSSTAFLHIGSSSTDLSGLILESDENKWEIRESGHLYFMDGTASRFMIKNDGNIGINDGNPGQLLSVTKAVAGEYITALLNSSSTGSGLLVRGGDTSSHHALSVQDYAGNWKFQVLGDGQVYHRGGNFHIWEDDTKLRIGAGEDLELWHDSNNSWISNKTGSLKIDNTSHGGDIGFYTQTSGGAGKTPLILGSDGNATFAGTVITPKVNTGANSPLGLGDDSDVIHIGYTDEIWTQSGTNSEVYLHINHRGYNHDAGQFRGVKIRNGKAADIAVFKGSDKSTTLSGNVAIGAAISATNTSHNSLQIGGNGYWASYATRGAGGEMDIGHNFYYAQSGNNTYISTDEATRYRQGAGKHVFSTAPSGSSGGTVTFTDRFSIENDGKVYYNNPGSEAFMWRYQTDDNYQLQLNQTVTSGLVKHNFNVRNAGTWYDYNLVLDRGMVGVGIAPTMKLESYASDSSAFDASQGWGSVTGAGIGIHNANNTTNATSNLVFYVGGAGSNQSRIAHIKTAASSSALAFITQNPSSGRTEAMRLDASQNATFYGNVNYGSYLGTTGTFTTEKKASYHNKYYWHQNTTNSGSSSNFWSKIATITGIYPTYANTSIRIKCYDGGDDQSYGYMDMYFLITQNVNTHQPVEANLVSHFGCSMIQKARLLRNSSHSNTANPATYEIWVKYGQSWIDQFAYEADFAGVMGTFNMVSGGTAQTDTPTGSAHVENTTFTTNFINGTVAGSSKSFVIDHPLESKKDDYNLVHASIESPKNDLIYRGVAKLSSGSATVNIDTHSGMSEGTFEALCQDVQCFTNNESTYDSVKGSVSGNILTISSKNSSSAASVSWMVVADRKDIDYDVEELKVKPAREKE